jgi:hypothetical protein
MPTDPPDAPPADSPPPQTPAAPLDAPDHRDMYLLILGLVIGLAMSPWIMGRFFDEPAFNRWYYGGGQSLRDYEAFIRTHEAERSRKHQELLDRLAATGATKEAVDELQAEFEAEGREERKPYVDAIQVERADHEAWYRGLITAVMLTAAVLMLLEPLFESSGSMAPLRRRLIFARYAVVATWIALILAKPHVLLGTPWLFVLLLVMIVIMAAALPQMLGGSRKPAEPV